jgi:hypothetical protein
MEWSHWSGVAEQGMVAAMVMRAASQHRSLCVYLTIYSLHQRNTEHPMVCRRLELQGVDSREAQGG